jgi:signal transduction histidine kinase
VVFAVWQVANHFLLMEVLRLSMLTYHVVSLGTETLAAGLIIVIAVRSLVRKNRELAELGHLKDLLTDSLVHDLRQPLTALLTGMSMAEYDSGFSESTRNLMSISRKGGENLLSMVDDLLAVSRLEAGQPVIAPEVISPGEFVSGGTEAAQQLARESGVDLAVRLPEALPAVRGDRERLSRVVMNLLGNALKFTPSGGRVEVSARLDDVSDRVQVSVSDTGPGIPQESREKIFDKFAVLDRGTPTDRISTGLGLTFCRMIVEAHGGQIWVESQPAEGAIFTFALPVHRT